MTDTSIYFTRNGVSNHVTPIDEYPPTPPLDDWNENNEGVGLEIQRAEENLITSYLIGQYTNSLNRNTNYAGAQWQYRFGNENLHADIGLLAGLATGYEAPVIPMLLPALSIGTKDIDFNLRYTPRIGNVTPEVYMFNMDYRLK